MNTKRLLLLCLVTSAALCGGCREKSGGRPVVRELTPTDVGASISVEAENFTGELEPPVILDGDPDASQGKCIYIPGGSGYPDYKHPVTGVVYPARWGAAAYHFTVEKAGEYRFWGRKFWEDGCGNSFTLVVNGGSPVIFGQDGSYGKWQWLPAPALFDLAAGGHTLEVLNREDGVKLDKFILTTDLDFVPQGKE